MASDTTVFNGREYVRHVTGSPGVYRMFGANDSLLYVGKAGNLRKRVAHYFLSPQLDPRLASMVSQITHMEVTLTRTEGEALLLEAQLIKSLRPRYNIVLRDDKSYPYIFVSEEPLPRFLFHRGVQHEKGRYFGPYPSADAVREGLDLLQKLFKVRERGDALFRRRTAPSLVYQIGRSSAPSTDLIDEAAYAEDVRHAIMLLEGRNDAVLTDLVQKMDTASGDLNYERAARLRDQIATLRSLQARHYVRGTVAAVDVFACHVGTGVACIAVLSFRGGVVVGSRNHFLELHMDTAPEAVLGQFLAQYYLDQPPPEEVLCDRKPTDASALAAMLNSRCERGMTLKWRVRGQRARFIALVARNANAALKARLDGQHARQARFEALRRLLELDKLPTRIECFDVSHLRGEAPVASCVVFGPEGAQKDQYRRYNIRDIVGGDDYAAMRQALRRRFQHWARGDGAAPDVLLIDGGKGQVAEAIGVLEDFGLDGIRVVGVAKGPSRRAGEETLVIGASRQTLEPGPDSPALQLIDAVRDEAHRFAIVNHRRRRLRSRQRGVLQEVRGVGAAKRSALLKAFGGQAGVVAAGVEELCTVRGIGRNLAGRIYRSLHS